MKKNCNQKGTHECGYGDKCTSKNFENIDIIPIDEFTTIHKREFLFLVLMTLMWWKVLWERPATIESGK
ncbi:MAG: hypothetical protein ABDK94_07275 [Atribacterota bacterium]